MKLSLHIFTFLILFCMNIPLAQTQCACIPYSGGCGMTEMDEASCASWCGGGYCQAR